MNTALPEIDTPLALVRYTAPDRVEVRFKEGLTFTIAGIAEMMKARQALGTAGPHRAMMVLPEDVDFELSMISTDHYKQIPQPNTEAVAWVAQNERNAHFTRLYLAYWPPPFPSEVFLTEAEGRAWLESVEPGH